MIPHGGIVEVVHAVVAKLGQGLSNSFEMAWQVWWALILGFTISAIVQAFAPRRRIERALGGGGLRPIALATALGAASSSCSYAAVAIARSLFERGASAASALAFQFASTNLVFELGAVLWALLGWRFTLAEFAGGFVMIAVMSVLVRAFIDPAAAERARIHARRAAAGHTHNSAGSGPVPLRALATLDGWSDVAHNFRNDVAMLWREIAIGLLLAGFAGLLGDRVFAALFLHHAAPVPRALENAAVGPLVAALTSVCSVGNVPLAAVLWSGGVGLAGVLAFIFADLIVLPIVAVYRRYYGAAAAVRLTALMFATIVIAALIVELGFAALGLTPHARPARSAIFAPVHFGATLVLDLLATALFVVLISLTVLRGARDPVCGMQVDRGRAPRLEVAGSTHYFCSTHCRERFADATAGGVESPSCAS